MRNGIRFLCCVALFSFASVGYAGEYVEGELLVKFKGAVTTKAAEGVHTKLANKRICRFRIIDVEHVRLAQGKSVEQGILEYEALPEVEYAEPNYYRYAQSLPSKPVIPNDTRFSEQWGLHNTGQVIQGAAGTPNADIDAPEAWRYPLSGEEVVVAVIDTGVGWLHPELGSTIWANPQEVWGDGIDNDGNGFIDDTYGYDFSAGDNFPLDQHQHGSHVAGIIGAIANDFIGVAGVCPGVRILPVRILNTWGATTTVGAAVQAADYIADLVDRGAPISIVNASYGGLNFSQSAHDSIQALQSRNVLFCAAAGNYTTNNDASAYYPATYDLPNIISVAASDSLDQLADFSHWGKTTVDLAAPGVTILSTVPYRKAYVETFEGAFYWTNQGKGLPWATQLYGGSQCLSDSFFSYYANNTDSYVYGTFPLDLTSISGIQIAFDCAYDLEMDPISGYAYDYLQLVLSTGGIFQPYYVYDQWTHTPWTLLSGTSPLFSFGCMERWESEYIENWSATDLYVGFHLVTDAINFRDGVYIDNVEVRVFPTAPGFNGTEQDFADGTSMACPMVAGAAAFLKSVEPALTYADIKALLLANVDPVTMPAGKETVTNGRLNLHKAVRNIDYDKDGLILEDELTTGANPHKPDTDGDGLPDGQEYHDIGTDPTLADSDKDGLPDKWEYDNDLDPLDDQGVNGAGGDPDGDGKTNLEEYQDGTNPQAPPSPSDINRDGKTDAVDVQLVINGALGLQTGGFNADVNRSGKVDAVDVQLVINAALGL